MNIDLMRRVSLFGLVSGLCASLTIAAPVPRALIAEALREPVLENAKMSTYNAVFEMVRAADTAADAAALEITSARSLRHHQRSLRQSWITSFGGFPARTPLRSRVTGVVQRDGYRVEKLLFESQPGLFVTALLFLPDARESCKPPYPGILICCGHSNEGKGLPGYQRGAVQAALAGFAALIIDPIDQGERLQLPGKNQPNNVHGHNVTGVSAMLLGWNTARFRIWDGMRALDYMQSRPEIDTGRLGVMGNSGGGTLSSYIMAIDDRIGAGAPSCYLTTFTELCDHIGAQDAEQNFFGQLAFGLNHSALVLARAPSPVCINCTHGDFFPFAGTQKTFTTTSTLFKRFGWEERLAMIDVPGPHGWQEGTRAGSVQWMRRWLKDDVAALPLDVKQLRAISASFDAEKGDCGLALPETLVTATGQVRDLPGARSVYDIMRDELDQIEKRRKQPSSRQLSQLVRKLAGIRAAEKIPYRHTVVGEKRTSGMVEIRQSFDLPSGIKLPAISLVPEHPAAPPILIVGNEGSSNHLSRVEQYLADGHPVMVADLTGTGEIGGHKHRFYGSKHADEGVGVMLYLLGRSLVALRAEDILICADTLSKHCGNAPIILCAGQGTVVAAYHAYAVEPGIFSRVEMLGPPPLSWSAVVRSADRYSYSDCVQNALRFYDWTDLYTPPPQFQKVTPLLQ
ncbi:MAG: alpha/beta hydrolase family protein [Kiritimatiellae bacterium]|nr:alpha/beta hydrolase family protein [Kiritimatiellia bacterium]